MEYNYPKFTPEMKKTHTILIPNMAITQFRLLEYALRYDGYKCEILGNCGSAVAQLGLKYVHNDTCYPALLVIGQFLDALNSGKYDLDHTALLITQTGGGCRASNYIHLLRKALVKAGYPQIPVASLNFSGLEKDSVEKINSWEDMSMRKKSSIQNETPVNKDSAIYHDTSKLLESYRDAVWNLELAVQQVRHSFEIEFGSSIEEFLDSIYLAGADVGGSKLEEYAKSIERSNKMLNTLMAAVDLLRTKHKHGEQYYWILYYSYLSPQELQNVEEIIEKLKPHIANISQRTYYRKRPKAIEALSTILWGFTSRDCISALNRFCPDENNMA